MKREEHPALCALREAGACAAGCLSAEELRERMDLNCVPGLESLLCAAFCYANGEEPEETVSRYARGADYHAVVKARLERAASALEGLYPGRFFRPFADASPIPEVWAAARAGLGRLGKNGLLLTEEAGSWVFLGFLATDAVIESTAGEIVPCENCGRCLRACPGGAAGSEPFDGERCLSALSQKRGELTEKQQALLAENRILWGCDRCQTVCPANQDCRAQPLPEFAALPPLTRQDVSLSDRAFRRSFAGRAFVWRGVQPLRRNFALLEKEVAQDGETRYNQHNRK